MAVALCFAVTAGPQHRVGVTCVVYTHLGKTMAAPAQHCLTHTALGMAGYGPKGKENTLFKKKNQKDKEATVLALGPGHVWCSHPTKPLMQHLQVFTVFLNIKHTAARNKCFYNLVNIYSLYLSFQMITKYFLTLPEPHFVPG